MNDVINRCVMGLNGVGRVFCDYAASVFIQSAVLVCVLFVADLLLRKRVRAVFRYCVWILVLVKLILPPALALPTGIGYWLGGRLPSVSSVVSRGVEAPGFEAGGRHPSGRPSALPETRHTEPIPGAGGAGHPAIGNPAGVTAITWQGIVFLMWFVGVLVFAAVLVQRLRFVRGLVAFSEPVDARFRQIIEECGRQVGIRHEIRLRASGTMSSPAICGLVRPIVLVPARLLDTLSAEGLKAVFIHELAHMKRGDLWINLAQTLLQVIHFYNPFVWFANAMIRRTREEAVDETVLVALGGRAEDYSNTLIDIGEVVLWKADLGLRLIGVAESERILRWRITHMLTRPIPKSARIGMLGTAVLVIVGILLLPMARAEKPNREASAVAQTGGAPGPEKATAAVESDAFVDPNSGIRFTKFKGITGPSDVIKAPWRMSLSPSGKFLLNHVTVVPLDGGTPFDLVDMPDAAGGLLSPDGGKVVFCGVGAMWLIEVDPDTGQPAGSPRKLLDGQRYPPTAWSPDSQRIVFPRRDNQPGDAGVYSPWTLVVAGGEPSPLADPSSFGLLSPDGKTVAYADGQYTGSSSVWVKAVAGGEAKKLGDGYYRPLAWSADGQWLACDAGQRLRLMRLADGHEVTVATPARPIQGYPQGRKLFFYQRSYEDKTTLRVVSVAGGPPAEFGWPDLSFEDSLDLPCWASDSRSILVEAKRGEEQRGFWAVPLDRKDPQALVIDTPMCRDAYIRLFSPGGSNLLLVMGKGHGDWDLWTVPVSLAQRKSVGPPVKVFGGMVPPIHDQQAFLDSWSPDGSKIAFIHNWDIWVADADGSNVRQLTKTPEKEGWPMWSPDGAMLAFFAQPSENPSDRAEKAYLQICVIPVSGGETRLVTGRSVQAGLMLPARYAWSPDGTEVTVVSDDDEVIANFPVAGGERRTLVRLNDLGLKRACVLRWSPDGCFLAFDGGTEYGDMKLYVYQADNSKLQRLTDEGAFAHWSPDSKWISYFSWQAVKTRPEAILWELDVEEALAKLAN